MDCGKKTGARPKPARARSHVEEGAEDLAVRVLSAVGLPPDTGAHSGLPKGHGGKILVAALLRKHTSAGNRWLAQRLAMGHTGSVSRLVRASGKDMANLEKLRELEKMLKCDTRPEWQIIFGESFVWEFDISRDFWISG